MKRFQFEYLPEERHPPHPSQKDACDCRKRPLLLVRAETNHNCHARLVLLVEPMTFVSGKDSSLVLELLPIHFQIVISWDSH